MSTNEWSLPETDVFDRIDDALSSSDGAVLATVIDVEGSAYRRPGAKMLLRPETGDGAGSITAGCLEDEVRALAGDVLAAGEPRVETWDLTGDDDVWGLGVGCNGVITVLLEPLSADYRPLLDARRTGDPVALLTVIRDPGDGAVGRRSLYRPTEGFADDTLDEAVREALADPAAELLEAGKAELVSVDRDGDRLQVFVDGIRPPPNLVVFGSGHDVAPVVELAGMADFRTTVVTFRGGAGTREAFPEADEVVSASPRDVPELREWDADTYAVVMTHNFVDDRLTVEGLLETPVEYVGLMGPAERFAEMVEDFEDEGRPVTPDERERIYTPIGVDLGGDSPYAIALSIVAEVVAVANDRRPHHLSERDGPIHDRIDVSAGE